jgi:hypothetical protein
MTTPEYKTENKKVKNDNIQIVPDITSAFKLKSCLRAFFLFQFCFYENLCFFRFKQVNIDFVIKLFYKGTIKVFRNTHFLDDKMKKPN